MALILASGGGSAMPDFEMNITINGHFTRNGSVPQNRPWTEGWKITSVGGVNTATRTSGGGAHGIDATAEGVVINDYIDSITINSITIL